MYLADDTVQVRTCLVVDVHQVGTEGLDFSNKLLRLHDHQVNVERLMADAGHVLEDREAERDVRDEYAVHDIDMEPVGTALVEPLHLRLKVGEVGRKERW